ncbi:uncharacterized protein VTP21DRAFT_11583 [Calcarisporiella thermophila]|uniref:uncharacterized protein n=1 Tax=Calcarisporiella thermophila TaxID=911321 RepID=UPI0037424016
MIVSRLISGGWRRCSLQNMQYNAFYNNSKRNYSSYIFANKPRIASLSPPFNCLQFGRDIRSTYSLEFNRIPTRLFTSRGDYKNRYRNNVSYGLYVGAGMILVLGLSYAAVPLYRMFCSATGYGGTPKTDSNKFAADRLIPKEDARRIKVTFVANTSRSMQWSFKPQQREVRVLPGETALAFYTARNESDKDIVGIATYNVTPFQAGQYFNKIQCFCFEEQKLAAGEEVDMPVFFFIDPEFAEDPSTRDYDTVTLSYTFFNAKYSESLQ